MSFSGRNPNRPVIGVVAGAVMLYAVDFLEWIRIDVPIGAVAVHGFCGIWGTWAIGLFATGQYGLAGPTGADHSVAITGLFYGGGTTQLVAQVIGSAAIGGAALVIGLIVMYAVKATGTLRISEEGELEGIDKHEHGAPAFHPEPAFVGSMPSSMSAPVNRSTPVTSSITS